VAARAWDARPFADIDALHAAMARAVATARAEEQLALIRAHPELAGKAALRGELTRESENEQGRAGLNQCSPAELARLTELNQAYRAKFGFPFILAVAGHTRASIIEIFSRRVGHDAATERAECLRQIGRIALIRLRERFGG
jgi:2-oxo-4-hydroxy-4-carboxy-5-ureidoimidazoline decarboxylase